MADENESNVSLTEAIKKVFAVGVGAAFLTEESIRTYLGELKLPKDILTMLLQGASKTKDEITGRMTNEILGIIKKIDFVKEFSKFAEDHKFKVTAEIEIMKKHKSEKL